MKRFCAAVSAVLLAACLVTPATAVGVDLSAMSWGELLELKAEINRELCSRDEWEQVEVPQGVWVVGEDIPEGMWTVTAGSGYALLLKWGYSLRENGNVDWSKSPSNVENIYPANDAENGEMTQYSFEAKKGMHIQVEYATAIFTTYTGKPDLGFKKK